MRAFLKALERSGKRLLALVAAVLLWRPWRRDAADAALARARKVLLVRVDDRVGEALLLTPLLATLHTRDPRPAVHVVVHPKVARILEGHPAVDRLHVLAPQGRWRGPFAPGIRALRDLAFDVVVDCGNWAEPAVTSALVARLAGPRSAVLGPAVWPVGALRTHPVPPLAHTRHEVDQRLALLAPLTGLTPTPALSHRPVELTGDLAELARALSSTPHAVVNPGGRLGWRRIPPEVFAAACRALLEAGRRPLVTWGPDEEGLARFVVDAAPGARLAPPTDLDALGALMAAAGCTLCNNTGPMHLSVAVGAPTLGLFLHMDPVRWGHDDPPHRVLDLTPEAGDRLAMEARVAAAVQRFAADLAGEGEASAFTGGLLG